MAISRLLTAFVALLLIGTHFSGQQNVAVTAHAVGQENSAASPVGDGDAVHGR